MTKKEVPVKSGVSKELTSLLNEANKKFGKNSLTLGCPVREDTGENLKEIKRIPTGSFAIDIALGGGIPIGRFSQISGIFSSTKTTQCIHILRETQRMGMLFSFHDAEGTTDDKYLKSLGVDTSKLPYNASGGLEETLQMILDFQKSKLVHGAILDSIEGLVPQAEYDSNMDENTRLGVKATKMNEFFRKYQANNHKLIREGYTPFTLIGINQMRDTMDKYNPTTKPGGRGKEFAASVDMELRKGEWLKVNKEIVGQVVNGCHGQVLRRQVRFEEE
jgi:recombination protein RecA